VDNQEGYEEHEEFDRAPHSLRLNITQIPTRREVCADESRRPIDDEEDDKAIDNLLGRLRLYT
jgi:hypothetical protein